MAESPRENVSRSVAARSRARRQRGPKILESISRSQEQRRSRSRALLQDGEGGGGARDAVSSTETGPIISFVLRCAALHFHLIVCAVPRASLRHPSVEESARVVGFVCASSTGWMTVLPFSFSHPSSNGSLPEVTSTSAKRRNRAERERERE